MTSYSSDAAPSNIPALTLGWRLQMALSHGGVSVQEMAEDLGMGRGSLSRWMNDHGAPPRSAFVKQWALRTGVNAQWLLTGETEESHRPDGPDDGFSEDVRRQGLEPRTRWLRASGDKRVIFLGDRRRRDRSLVAIAS